MRIRSFKLKLTLSYIFVVLVSLGFVAFFLDKKLEENSLHNIQSALVTEAGLIAGQLPLQNVKKEDIVYLSSLVKGLSRKTKSRITIIGKQGGVLADSEKTPEEVLLMENHIKRPEVAAALTGAVGIETRFSSTLDIDMLYVALPIKEESDVAAVLRLALALEDVRETAGTVKKTVFLGLMFGLGIAFVLGAVIAANTISPVNKMIRVARRFSKGDFSRKIFLDSKDELGELALALNNMAQDIENKVRQIEAQNQKLAAVFNSMIEGIIVVDKDSRIVSVNPAIEKIFGVEKKEAQGKVFLEAVRNNDIAEVINNVLREGKFLQAEVSLILPVRGVFEVNATPVFENNSVSGCLAVIHDITEIRRLEKVRSDFVANVSHELRTPLTSIKGFTETLLEGALEDKENSREFLKIIRAHAERLDSLVNDLLSLADLESKEAELRREKFSLRKLTDEVILGFGAQLKRKEIEARNDLSADISPVADRSKLEQVLTNLIGNAIKFNKKGGSVKIYSEDIGDKLKVIVEDTGIGIPEKDLSRIFERFYRVDKARSRALGGTGLGLSIVKHIIELHGGSAGVESVEGLGSKFWFILP